ncbi:cytochrome P450 [Mycolicibacterium conceptionense]|uniref:Cytochrome P450 n=1 Tax=Mycolicibacterium conceptionense TaxID=451644 RepID=A0A0U1DI47_9MYCO|nr:cytochrome P450 [Mycolicibacterium conceptionense]
MPESLERHAANWDLRHQDFNDNDFLYDVYSVMRQQSPFARTDNPFLSATPAGAWVAVRYAECVKILQDWEHFSSNPTPEGAEQLAGDLVITLDPPRQQKFRKVLNPYFSPARMKHCAPRSVPRPTGSSTSSSRTAAVTSPRSPGANPESYSSSICSACR